MQVNDVISIEREGPLALIVIDNPPVNAAGHAVREGLQWAIEAVGADAGVEAVAIYGKGRAFIAGADIREFGKPRLEPILTDVCNRIEACPKPVVAVLHGSCFGGGLEVAIGCHARVAIPGVKVGFPEVTLGVFTTNPRAHRVYEKIGYRVVETRPGAWTFDGAPVDEIVMSLSIGESA